MFRLSLNCIAAVALIVSPSVASAAFIVSIQNSTAVVGQQGHFDVFVTSDSAQNAPDSVSEYIISLLAPTPSGGVSFTSIVTAETDADDDYIFSSSSPQIIAPGPTTVSYSDSVVVPVAVSEATTFGVGRVFYQALAVGQYFVDFNRSETAFRFDVFDGQIESYRGGIITVTAAPSAVPEPSSAILMAIAGVAGVAFRRVRRKPSTERQSVV